MAEYVRSVADWRRRRYDDDLRDARNLRSAAALEEFAEFAVGLPADDPRLIRLGQLCLRGNLFEPSQQVAYEIGRFRFYTEEATLDGFLTQLVMLAEADRGEHGVFGGPQVPGDNPWD
jgi:hypothetical protein